MPIRSKGLPYDDSVPAPRGGDPREFEQTELKEAKHTITRLEQELKEARESRNRWMVEYNKLKAKVPRWIPVDERLPEWKQGERDEKYITVSRSDFIDITGYNDGTWLTSWPHRITHWQPLPDPPEDTDE